MGLKDVGVKQNSKIYFRRVSPFARRVLFTVMSAGNYECDESYYIEDYGNTTDCIVLCIDKGQIEIDRPTMNKHIASTGEVVLVASQMHFRCHACGDLRIRWMRFNGAVTSKYVDEIIRKVGYIFSLSDAGLAGKYIDILYNMLETNFDDENYLSVTIHRIFAEMTRAGNSIEDEDFGTVAAVNRAIEFINQHYGEKITLAEMAERAQFSVYYFSKVFKKQKKTTPFEYLEDIRIQHAKNLLYTTNYPLEVIAGKCGYDSASYFIRQFKKHENITPAKFRKLNFDMIQSRRGRQREVQEHD